MEYRVKVTVGVKKEGVDFLRDGRLAIAVAAPRKDNKANERARELLAEHLNVPLEKVKLVRGHTQPTKVMHVAE